MSGNASPIASRFNIVLHPHRTTLPNIPEGERAFFFLRDPIARFVSAFNSRLREGRPRYHYPWRDEEKVAFSIFKTPNELATALSAADSFLRKQAEAAMHGIGQVEEACARQGHMRFSLWTGDLGFALFLWDCVEVGGRFPTLDVF